MNRSSLRLLIVGASAVLLLAIGSWGWVASHSALRLVFGGVKTFPQGTVFLPKQTPAVISLLTSPEKIKSWRQGTISLSKRQGDREEWRQWSQNLVNRVGLDYQQLKPWLGDEFTWAITARDFDHNLRNGSQPGYLIVARVKNSNSAQDFLRNYYGAPENMAVENYKGAQIVSTATSQNAQYFSGALVGKFLLLANHPQVIKEAIHQAQAVSLNLQQSDDYRRAVSQFSNAHIGFVYCNVPETLAWLDINLGSTSSDQRQIFSALVSTNPGNLIVRTVLFGVKDAAARAAVYQAFLKDSALAQLLPSLTLESRTYLDLTESTSLLNQQAQPYEMSKLTIKNLFPHLKAIAIDNQGITEQIGHSKIRLQLDS